MTVGKTFVNNLIREHQYEIQVLRKQIKTWPPKSVPPDLIWGMDLTAKTDATGHSHPLLGVVEHHSRACLALSALRDKSSAALLRVLLDLIERYGKPACLRTDNESVFSSRLFRFGLGLLGIRQQRIDPACPWQNGRVKRFFGTLKAKLDAWEVTGLEELNRALHLFRFWYNHVRPHQNLHGRTPAEVWNGVSSNTQGSGQRYWFDAWDGLLVGYYWPSG